MDLVRRRLLQLLQTGVLCTSATAARAESAAPAIRYDLAYEAPPGCPTRDQVAGRVTSFAPRTLLSAENPLARVRLSISGQRDFVAAIAFLRPGEAETNRVLPAGSCAEAAEVAALVIAILLDPEAASRVNAAETRTAAPAPAPLGTRSTPAPASAPVTQDERAPVAGELWWGAQVLAGVTWAIAPRAALEAGAGATLETQGRALLSPWFALSAHFAQSGSSVFPDGSAKFRLFSGQLRACPLRVRVAAAPLWVGPCARLELGRLQGIGQGSVRSRSPAIFWAAAGPGGRAEVRLAAVALGLEAGATFPFRRDSFYFDPDQTSVFRLPAVAFWAGATAGVSFP